MLYCSCELQAANPKPPTVGTGASTVQYGAVGGLEVETCFGTCFKTCFRTFSKLMMSCLSHWWSVVMVTICYSRNSQRCLFSCSSQSLVIKSAVLCKGAGISRASAGTVISLHGQKPLACPTLLPGMSSLTSPARSLITAQRSAPCAA